MERKNTGHVPSLGLLLKGLTYMIDINTLIVQFRRHDNIFYQYMHLLSVLFPEGALIIISA